jgi:integrase
MQKGLKQVQGGFSKMVRAGSVKDPESGQVREIQFRLRLLVGEGPEALQLAELRLREILRFRDVLVDTGHAADAEKLMREAGLVAADPEKFASVLRVAGIVAKTSVQDATNARPRWSTWGELAEAWNTQELARHYPGSDYGKSSADTDEGRIRMISEKIGQVPLLTFNDEHYWCGMRAVPAGRSARTVQAFAQIIRRVLRIAVEIGAVDKWPLKPTNKLPKLSAKDQKIFTFLYPSEDAQLLACDDAPFAFRVLWGFIVREGLRISEAVRIRWEHIDRKLHPDGVLKVLDTKTGVWLEFILRPGTLLALDTLRALIEEDDRYTIGFSRRPTLDGQPWAYDGRGPFSWLTTGQTDHAAEKVRGHLVMAGVDRRALLFNDGRERKLREHDLRATYVTLAKLAGVSDDEIKAHTGHAGAAMIAVYNHSRSLLERLTLGRLEDLDVALGLRARTEPHAAAPAARDTSRDTAVLTSIGIARDDRGSSLFSAVVRETGVEPARLAALEPKSAEARREPQNPDGSAPAPAFGTAGTDGPSRLSVTVEDPDQPLKRALDRATAAEKWDLAEEVMAELRERRRAREAHPAATPPNVTSLDAARKRRDEGSGK